jgi:hypothetical protein
MALRYIQEAISGDEESRETGIDRRKARRTSAMAGTTRRRRKKERHKAKQASSWTSSSLFMAEARFDSSRGDGDNDARFRRIRGGWEQNEELTGRVLEESEMPGTAGDTGNLAGAATSGVGE